MAEVSYIGGISIFVRFYTNWGSLRFKFPCLSRRTACPSSRFRLNKQKVLLSSSSHSPSLIVIILFFNDGFSRCFHIFYKRSTILFDFAYIDGHDSSSTFLCLSWSDMSRFSFPLEVVTGCQSFYFFLVLYRINPGLDVLVFEIWL